MRAFIATQVMVLFPMLASRVSRYHAQASANNFSEFYVFVYVAILEFLLLDAVGTGYFHRISPNFADHFTLLDRRDLALALASTIPVLLMDLVKLEKLADEIYSVSEPVFLLIYWALFIVSLAASFRIRAFVSENHTAAEAMVLHEYDILSDLTTDVLEKDPFYAQFIAYGIYARVRLGESSEALHLARKLVTFAPEDPVAVCLDLLTRSASSSDFDPKEAIQDLKAALQRSSKDSFKRANVLETMTMLGLYENAFDAVDVPEFETESSDDGAALARILLIKGELEEMEELLTELLMDAEWDEDIHRLFIYNQLKLGKKSPELAQSVKWLQDEVPNPHLETRYLLEKHANEDPDDPLTSKLVQLVRRIESNETTDEQREETKQSLQEFIKEFPYARIALIEDLPPQISQEIIIHSYKH